MFNSSSKRLPQVAAWLTSLLIVKVTLSVISNFANYYPPNFDVDFLRDREGYFWNGYHWAFYTHIVTGPISIFLGLILISNKFLLRFPICHRFLGRIQGFNVLVLMTPSGLWMSYYAVSGPIAATGLAVLAVLTATCMVLGWRCAVQRRFVAHRRWMWRCFLFLCSAIVLRLIIGLAIVTGFFTPWLDSIAIWISWIIPLSVFELMNLRNMNKPRVIE